MSLYIRYCDTRLHVLEVQEVLAALRHHLQVGQQVQKLGEFVLDSEKRLGRERMGERYQSNCTLNRIISLYRSYGGDRNGLCKVA